jgi:hypothetical protein
MMRTLLGAAILVGLMASALSAQKPRVNPDRAAIHPPYAHVVVFRMKKDAPNDATSKAIADCRNLLSTIPAVRSVHAGRPAKETTPDVPKMEYDFALIVLVDDAKGLKAYLEHPMHLEYVKRHGKNFDMEKLQVFDFVNQAK